VTVLNPRTHPRGAPPSFSLPLPNPNPSRMTDALWWLVCMRELLEPIDSENGGTYANKPGYHNAGENLPDHGLGNSKTDHSIRRAPDRSGLWWKTKSSAHDWTFLSAQKGNYANIQKYTRRLVNAMRDPKDLRPDDVYAYTLGQTDGDPIVEGYNEYTDSDDTSADKTHLWHRHDSFRRNIIGDFWAMWKALTIDMGWTYAEWLKSVTPKPPAKPVEELPVNQTDFTKLFLGALKDPDAQVREKAAIGLAFRRDPRIMEPLLAAMEDGDSQVREKAAIALGASGDPRAIPALTRATRDPDSQVREKAVSGLVLLGLRR